MTAGSVNSNSERLTRRISDLVEKPGQTLDQLHDEGSLDEQSSSAGRKRPRTNLSRLVSLEAQYISENDDDDQSQGKEKAQCLGRIPNQPNPLYGNSNLLSSHILALQLEAELFPMRQQIARLMSHPTHNRRGIFNAPVDTVALGLVDYHLVVTKPMDLGTVKAKLHAVAYNSRDEVADDVRLVFQNAMKYNPPQNTVHIAAKNLLMAFEEAYELILAISSPSIVMSGSSPVKSKVLVSPLDSVHPRPRLEVVSPSKRGLTRSLSTVEESTFTTDLQKGQPPEVAKRPHGEVASLHRPVSLGGTDLSTIAVAAVSEPPIQSFDTSCAKPVVEKALKRAMNIAAKHARHSCRSCLGRTCGICNQGCLNHEPALLICTGTNCLGAKIRKGAVYYIAKDGSRQFCQRCYTNLQAVLPHTSDQMESFGSCVRYKRDLLKRKNEEEVAESWLTCKSCHEGFHKICSLYNEYVHSEQDYECPSCAAGAVRMMDSLDSQDYGHDTDKQSDSEYYTFLSGSETPVKLDEVMGFTEVLSAESFPETRVSAFIQERVRNCIAHTDVENADKTITVRIISDCSKNFKVPEVVRNHFRQPLADQPDGVPPPASVNYTSKAITLFQKIDGLDVCIFCMYVQEYDCNDDFQGNDRGEQKKRVYIAYLDSVEHFRPRECRTEVFHEIIVAYLATARVRGYESAHIWACPPSRGNSFVFWNHPSSQRTPSKERLISWYHGVLSRGIKSGVITKVESLFESSFPLSTVRCTDANEAFNPESMTVCEDGVLGGRMTCPPLMDGDFWIEEAVRVHASNFVRHLRSKPIPCETIPLDDPCPASQVACLIRDKIMIQNVAIPFNKPVNAGALKLTDYHKIISKPMDLGTVYSRCILGEFATLGDVVTDIELVFSNAMRYNPKGHPIHAMAIEARELFFKELNSLTQQWQTIHEIMPQDDGWKLHANTSMSLDYVFEHCLNEKPESIVHVSSQANIVSPTISIDNIDTVSPATGETIKEGQGKLIPVSPVSQDKIQTETMKPVDQLISTARPTLDCKSGRSQLFKNKGSSKCTETVTRRKLELPTGGQDAILHKMVGDDVWMLDKKSLAQPKAAGAKKKSAGKNSAKRRKGAAESTTDEPPSKRRRQCWLGEEVAMSVRKMRTAFFSCSLLPRKDLSDEEALKESDFQTYVASFKNSTVPDVLVPPSRIADARHALLEFSQYRNLEFDTLRRAKYSTSILLYHLHYDSAPGLIPTCCSCNEVIKEIRWHRVRRVEERHHTGRVPPTLRAARIAQIGIAPEVAEASHKGEELCSCCHEKVATKEDFIPLPVSLKVTPNI